MAIFNGRYTAGKDQEWSGKDRLRSRKDLEGPEIHQV